MELVAASGLTKGTVHRHLWLLRFAGLVRAHMTDGRFSLRPGAFGRASEALSSFALRR
jgi:DNA-binding IclR family transcriptional regulator